MNTKTFSKKLEKIIDNSEEFIADKSTLRREISLLSRSMGFDQVILVSGKDSSEVFMLHIQKI